MPEARSETGGRKQRRGGAIIALLAAALIGLAAFMPKLYSQTIQLQHNRPIEGWEGVALIVCAAMVLFGAVLGLRWKRWGWLVCGAGTAAFGLVIYASSGARLIVQEGPLEGAVYAAPGIGLVTAGLGALVAIGGGLTIGLARASQPSLGRPPRMAKSSSA
jgi:hypothetical protein